MLRCLLLLGNPFQKVQWGTINTRLLVCADTIRSKCFAQQHDYVLRRMFATRLATRRGQARDHGRCKTQSRAPPRLVSALSKDS